MYIVLRVIMKIYKTMMNLSIVIRQESIFSASLSASADGLSEENWKNVVGIELSFIQWRQNL